MSMNIVPWAWKKKKVPVGRDAQSLSALQRHMNRMFNDLLAGSSILPEVISEPLSQLGERFTGFTPNVNVRKGERCLIVSVELPGMDENDIELSLTKEGLSIRGERRPGHDERDEPHGEGAEWTYVESTFGSFERIVPLSDLLIDEDRVEATSAKGIVTITLPFKEAAQVSPKKVTIRPS